MPDRPTVALFTGDSITDMCRRTDPSGHLGAGYVRRIAALAAAEAPHLTVLNTGISGDRTTDLLRRWDSDVIQLDPDVLTILIGVNDMWRRYDSAMPMSAEEFGANLRSLLDTTRARIKLRQLIIMEPFVVPISEDQRDWYAEDLGAKIQVTRDAALEFDALHIPLHDIFTEKAARDGAGSVIDDGVHPSAGGHELIAQQWWAAAAPALT